MSQVDVSIIIPVLNCEAYLDQCFGSIRTQEIYEGEHRGISIEISVYDDGSRDKSLDIIEKWRCIFNNLEHFSFIASFNEDGKPKGVGLARNIAVQQSNGIYLAFCDADDVMLPERIIKQYKSAAVLNTKDNFIIGSKLKREPENSTKIFTEWANNLSQDQLYTQIYQSFGPTILMPTWFMHRNVFNKVGGFDESGKGTPEDLIFFYKHLHQNSGKLYRIDDVLMIYRHHINSATFSVSEETIWNLRIKEFEDNILCKWPKFSIWNAGKLGKRFFRALKSDNQKKCLVFGDVDENKINRKYFIPHPLKFQIPIVHVTDLKPPIVICVKTELTLNSNNEFHKILQTFAFKEGIDYFYFN